MSKFKNFNRSSIVMGVVINLIMTMIFLVFITLGYRSTIENAAIQDDTFRTHFQSRLILKSINGLNHSRSDLLLGMKKYSTELIDEAEDQILGARSNYQRLISEQHLNKTRVSNSFNDDFDVLQKMYAEIFRKKNLFNHQNEIMRIFDHTTSLIQAMHDEESSLWVDESLKLHAFSKVKTRNQYIFFGLTICFILIQLIFIYFTIVRYRLNKKINSQHERLVLQARLSTLGMMSSDLAHEINTPLMVIDGRLRNLQNELLNNQIENEKMYRNIEIIKRNSNRIQSIIKSFKTMSKSDESDDFEPLEFTTIFEEVKDLIHHKLQDEHIQLTFHNMSSDFWIEVRRIQIVQVLANLINNSIDAIKGSESPWVQIHNEVIDDQIIIRVTDSGDGIDEMHVENIFDPFYSTKVSSEGAGLGLSISKKIMKEHAGDLFYNPDSPNTQFVLTFRQKKAHS